MITLFVLTVLAQAASLAAFPKGHREAEAPSLLITAFDSIPVPPEPGVAPNEELLVGHYVLVVTDVRDPAESPYPTVMPTAGHRFVAVSVLIRNEDSRPAPYSYLHFRLRDSSGATITATAIAAAEPTLGAGNVAPGRDVSGWVTFVLDGDAPIVALTFHPSGALGQHGVVWLATAETQPAIQDDP